MAAPEPPPADAAPPRLPGSVLFVCSLNAVRSPIAAALMRRRYGRKVYVASAGCREGGAVDGFAAAVMAELGIDLASHTPRTLDEVHDGSFDLIVALSGEAEDRARAATRAVATEVEHWPTEDVTAIGGRREERLAAYRRLREEIDARIKARFG